MGQIGPNLTHFGAKPTIPTVPLAVVVNTSLGARPTTIGCRSIIQDYRVSVGMGEGGRGLELLTREALE